MVKRSRLKAKVELKSRRSSRRPASPEGLLIEDVEDEDLPAGTKMTDSWIEELKVCESLGEWSELVGSLFSRQDTFKELGLTLLELISRLPTPLGRFTREYCDSARPHPGATPKPQRGDILPIAPWRISTRIEGITEANQAWVWLLVVIHNFNYCTGWQKPVCVPFHDSLNENQLKALTGLGKLVDRNIMSGEPLGTLGEAKKLLSSKKFDYAGKPIEYMEDLEAWRVEPAWPKKGEAGIQPIEKYLSRETREQMKDPRAQLLPVDLMPSEVPRSRVRATDDEWFKICKMAHERGMMKVVDDGLLWPSPQSSVSPKGLGLGDFHLGQRHDFRYTLPFSLPGHRRNPGFLLGIPKVLASPPQEGQDLEPLTATLITAGDAQNTVMHSLRSCLDLA